MVVTVANTIVDKDAMVVCFSDTAFANAAVFRSSWFEMMTGITGLARMEDGVIIRIQGHVVSMVLWTYVSRICICSKIKECVW